MTTSIQTSTFNNLPAGKREKSSFYSVVVNGEDGNFEEFEVEASSDAEAFSKASDLAQYYMIDITYIEVYKQA